MENMWMNNLMYRIHDFQDPNRNSVHDLRKSKVRISPCMHLLFSDAVSVLQILLAKAE